MPGEWETQKSVWLIWPYNEKDWPKLFKKIPDVVGKISACLSINQNVNLIIRNLKDISRIKKIIKKFKSKISNIKFHSIKSDRIWIRDSGPIFLINKKTKNKIKKIVLEGGSIDVNGKGTIILTKECLLSKVQERNPGVTKLKLENALKDYLNVSNFIWLNRGIDGDDTHGHVDDITRFVSQNTIMTAIENNRKDKNYKRLKENLKILKKSKIENGKKLKIIKIPMPKPIYIDNIKVPASYLNFYIANKIVLLPVFNDKNDKKVFLIFKKFFKSRKIIPIDCSELIWGFGAIHCMTQQEPYLNP